jgi:hypothetical protein
MSGGYQPTAGSEPIYLNGGYTKGDAERIYGRLKKRAAFDLECGAEELVFVQLADKKLSPIGVRGCGQKATYVNVGGEWVMDSASGEAPAPASS